MDELRSLLFGRNHANDSKGTGLDPQTTGAQAKPEPDQNVSLITSLSDDSPNPATPDVVADPKVTEFFKDFPEPYRQKAVERYSKREGLHRFDFIRDMAMKQEKQKALKGIFVDDQEEIEEIKTELDSIEMEERREQRQREFLEREIPPWEKMFLTYIPLQSSDDMQTKLFKTANLSVIGIFALAHGIYFRKRRPREKVKTTLNLVGTLGLFIFFQVAAVQRLMDWGRFDRSVDDRNIVEKYVSEYGESYKKFKEYLDKKLEDR